MRITCTRPTSLPPANTSHTYVWYTYATHQKYGYPGYTDRRRASIIHCYMEIWQWLPGNIGTCYAPYWRYRCGATMRRPMTVAEWYAEENRRERFYASVLAPDVLGRDFVQLYGVISVPTGKLIHDTE